MPYVIKAAVTDAGAKLFSFRAQKTMYRGKDISVKDEIFVFASENEGGSGLIARGVVTSVERVAAKRAGPKVRHTPRVSITVRRVATAKRHLGRMELKPFRAWDDGRPETELSFKFYRQATNKIAGISEDTASFLRKLFWGADMKTTSATKVKSPSKLIDAKIKELGDWRGTMLSRIRALIKDADPDVVEEWKWRGVPVWSHDGIISTGETYKSVVKMTFAKGAALKDPARLFNSSLEGNTRRAIDFREGEKINEEGLKTLIRAAVTLNKSKAKR
jgi:hypothetical protein